MKQIILQGPTFTSLHQYVSKFTICFIEFWMTWVIQAHYGDPLWSTLGFNIIIYIVWLFQKYDTFNFEYQLKFSGPTIIIFTKLILCIIIKIIIVNFIIYIERSMNIFIIYIGIIRPLFHFDYIKFKVSLVFKIINFNEIKKLANQTMFIILHVNVITCQIFNLPHLSHLCWNFFFLNWKFSN